MKVAIYCRLSEEDKYKQSHEDDSHSIQNQKVMLTQYALAQGWEIYDIYSDDDYAGADRNRPAFNRLLNDAQSHLFDIILCKTQSRFTRELELVERYIHGLLPQWGIRFISIVDNADTENKGNKKSRQINGLVNEWYLEDMSDNIRSVLTNRRQNGLHIGSFALYGYQKDPCQKGHLIIDEEAASIIREIFSLYAKGHGKTAIARMLNNRGIPNPTEYKRQKGLHYQSPHGKTSTLWRYDSIASILKNEMYIGNMVQGKYGSISYKTKINKPRPKESWYVVEGTHDAIIDRDLWLRVQNVLAQKYRPFSTGQIGIFSGKAKCMYCGAAMRVVKKKTHRYLQCPTKYLSSKACIGSFIGVDKLTQIVIHEINNLSIQYLDMQTLASSINIQSTTYTQEQQLHAALADCRKKLNTYKNSLREMYIDKINHVLTEDEFSELVQDVRCEIKYIEDYIANTEKQIADMQMTASQGNGIQELIAYYVFPKILSRDVVEGLIQKISVGKRTHSASEVPITIYWNF